MKIKKIHKKYTPILTQIALGADASCIANPDIFKMMEYARANDIVPNITVADIDDKVADELSKPRRIRAPVNVGDIERHSPEEGVVLIPGKVLGDGTINKGVSVVALEFSETALNKISAAGGRTLNIFEAVKEFPQGTNVKLMK